MQTITKCLYLVPRGNMEPVIVGDNEYAMFDIVAENGTVLNTYDYLIFDKDVACDFQNGRVRIFPRPLSWVIHPKVLQYDDESQRVTCIDDPADNLVVMSGDME